MENRTELLVKLLETRTRNHPDALVSFGYLGNIENGSDPETRRSADWHWRHKSAPDLKIEFLNSSGHWKINTILDPGLKPLPAEIPPSASNAAASSAEKEEPSP
ncbi:MAG: hypothetical protein ACK526_09475 [Planctomyces sp.]|jgi:hypothetical protein